MKRTKAWRCAAQMPPLFHTLPDHEFDLARSQVVDWLCRQPEIRNDVFSRWHAKKAIVFCDGRWQGANWQNEALG